MTIVAIGAPITEAERAAIPASIREDPNIPIPIEFPMYVKIPPKDAPRTKAGENTPPKKPILRQTTVTNNLSNKIKIKKSTEYWLLRTPLIVSPPSPNISGINPPRTPHKITAYRIRIISFDDILATFFCNLNKLVIKMTAIIAHIGPSKRDIDTEGKIEIFESVF